ncbi:MAG: FKBP-type peptidyl-prolyl cis-trans isomerase, partial [Burkholderiaceae bacterium]
DMQTPTSQTTDKPPVVGHDSHLTLHYRVSLPETDAAVINTFDARPATLQMGQGQLAQALEAVLIGLPEGSQRCFDLAAGEAYGQRHADLVQTIARRLFDANVDTAADGDFEAGDPVQITGPGGERVAGVVKSINADVVVVDFNHPLAGRAIVFEVDILGVL